MHGGSAEGADFPDAPLPATPGCPGGPCQTGLAEAWPPRLPKEAMVFSASPFLSSALILDAVAPAPSPITQFAPLLFIGVIFYFLLIRPQQKQRKEQQKLIEALKTGDKVVTSSGIHGLISNVKEKTVLLKVADNVKIEIDKAAVATVLERSSEEGAA